MEQVESGTHWGCQPSSTSRQGLRSSHCSHRLGCRRNRLGCQRSHCNRRQGYQSNSSSNCYNSSHLSFSFHPQVGLVLLTWELR